MRLDLAAEMEYFTPEERLSLQRILFYGRGGFDAINPRPTASRTSAPRGHPPPGTSRYPSCCYSPDGRSERPRHRRARAVMRLLYDDFACLPPTSSGQPAARPRPARGARTRAASSSCRSRRQDLNRLRRLFSIGLQEVLPPPPARLPRAASAIASRRTRLPRRADQAIAEELRQRSARLANREPGSPGRLPAPSRTAALGLAAGRRRRAADHALRQDTRAHAWLFTHGGRPPPPHYSGAIQVIHGALVDADLVTDGTAAEAVGQRDPSTLISRRPIRRLVGSSAQLTCASSMRSQATGPVECSCRLWSRRPARAAAHPCCRRRPSRLVSPVVISAPVVHRCRGASRPSGWCRLQLLELRPGPGLAISSSGASRNNEKYRREVHRWLRRQRRDLSLPTRVSA
jgi:hypothetical protein